MEEQIAYKTIDLVDIVGTWKAPSTPAGSVLLLHMWPADRSSWRAFQDQLFEHGLASLAIDLRGHGQSGGEASDDARDMQLDVEGALAWLRGRGQIVTGIVGASIGANLALHALASHPEISTAVLLSPGIEYHQVTTQDAAQAISGKQAVLIVASAGDDQASADASQVLYDAAATEQKTIRLLQQAGHGTALFVHEPVLAEEVINWMIKHKNV